MGFKKGHIGYNKGKKLHGEWRKCLRCNKKVWFNMSRILNGGGRYCSQDCSNKSTAKRGELNQNYSPKSKNYSTIHYWLYRTYGLASKCENPKCPKKSKVFHWAKIKRKKYLRKRDNFMQLCRPCHMNYDGTIPKGWNKGLKTPLATRKKISIGTKLGMKLAGYNVKTI